MPAKVESTPALPGLSLACGKPIIARFDGGSEAWVQKLTNLVLLAQRKNAQANNAEFSVKKAKYFSPKGGTSNFALTNQVLAEPVWTLDVLQRRQDALIAKIVQVWEL